MHARLQARAFASSEEGDFIIPVRRGDRFNTKSASGTSGFLSKALNNHEYDELADERMDFRDDFEHYISDGEGSISEFDEFDYETAGLGQVEMVEQ